MQFACNPRAIYEYMKQHYPEYRFFWSIEQSREEALKGHGLNIINPGTLKWLFVVGVASKWVVNTRLVPDYFYKSKRTTYIQTWHGTPLKKLVFDMEEVYMQGYDKERHRSTFAHDAKNWDYLISPSPYASEIFRSAFRYEGQIVETGYPRNDELIFGDDPKIRDDIRKKLGLPLDKKIMLYAPTWRDDEAYNEMEYKFQLPFSLEAFNRRFGSEYVLLLRMHYYVAENFDLTGYENVVMDFSAHRDINELYLASDVLITDYSSVFFDYLNLKRPIIFYMYDLKKYRDKIRGFYFDITRDSPGPITQTESELFEAIERLDDSAEIEQFRVAQEKFFERFCGLQDGQATKRVVEQLIVGK